MDPQLAQVIDLLQIILPATARTRQADGLVGVGRRDGINPGLRQNLLNGGLRGGDRRANIGELRRSRHRPRPHPTPAPFDGAHRGVFVIGWTRGRN